MVTLIAKWLYYWGFCKGRWP